MPSSIRATPPPRFVNTPAMSVRTCTSRRAGRRLRCRRRLRDGSGGHNRSGLVLRTKASPVSACPRISPRRQRIVSAMVGMIGSGLQPRWTLERRMGVAMSHLGACPTAELVTHRFDFDSAVEAYRLIDTLPEQVLAVLLDYADRGRRSTARAPCGATTGRATSIRLLPAWAGSCNPDLVVGRELGGDALRRCNARRHLSTAGSENLPTGGCHGQNWLRPTTGYPLQSPSEEAISA